MRSARSQVPISSLLGTLTALLQTVRPITLSSLASRHKLAMRVRNQCKRAFVSGQELQLWGSTVEGIAAHT